MSGGDQLPVEPPLVFREPPPLREQVLLPNSTVDHHLKFTTNSHPVCQRHEHLHHVQLPPHSYSRRDDHRLVLSFSYSDRDDHRLVLSFVHQEPPCLGLGPLMCKLKAELS